MIIEIESDWRETGIQCANGCGMTYSDEKHPPQCPACYKKIVRHTHPEIIHPDARRLLALELFSQWRAVPYWESAKPWKLQKNSVVNMARRVDLYLRTGAGRVF